MQLNELVQIAQRRNIEFALNMDKETVPNLRRLQTTVGRKMQRSNIKPG